MMGEQSVLGCGRFTEEDWAALITHEGTPGGPLFKHAHECKLCQAELDAFVSLTAAVRHVTGPQRPTRTAFVDGVLAAVQHERRLTKPVQGRGGSTGFSPVDLARSRFGLQPDFPGWWRRRTVPGIVAAALIVFVVLGAGLWSGPWSASRSTGEVLPGGVIVKATNGSPSTVRAAGLSADATVAAVAGQINITKKNRSGRTIRVTLGMQAAASASANNATAAADGSDAEHSNAVHSGAEQPDPEHGNPTADSIDQASPTGDARGNDDVNEYDRKGSASSR